MLKLFASDYVLVNSKTKKPIESYEIINHYTSVIDEFNERLESENCEYISMANLSKKEKTKYLKAIKKREEFNEKI
tara:strand:- start:540 stop:767 length:228 start_codon:yes stop_codon:yes gene_type:complete